MNKRTTEMVVGVVFVGGLLFLLSYTIVLSGFRLGPTKNYLVNFPNVYGLKEGDPVRVEGHEKGKVKLLTLLPEGKIRAVLMVSPDVEIYKEGGEVTVTPFSPLGGRVVEIDRGTASSERGTYQGYYSDPDGEGAEVIEGEAEGELLQSLNRLISDNSPGVKRIVDNIGLVSERLTQKDAGVLGYLINNEEGAARLDRITARMDKAAERVDNILARVERGEGVVGGIFTEGTELDADVKGAAKGIRGSTESLATILERADRGESALGVLVSDDEHSGVSDEMRGIVVDIKKVTGNVADGQGTLGKLVNDDRLYDHVSGTAENLESITEKIDSGEGLLGVLLEEESGQNARDTLEHMASITSAIDDPEAGTLGLLVHDDTLRGRISRIAEEVERLVVEFRDSAEDLREQAPVNAFIGAVFSAF